MVVADTGPLNYLVLIGNIGVQNGLFGVVHVPDAVISELRHPAAPPAVRSWSGTPPTWLVIHPSPPAPKFPGPRLGTGERAAIALANALSAALMLMDDRLGVRTAAEHGLAAVGTLRVLRLAADRGMLDFALAVERLRATNFRVHPNVLRALMSDNP